MKIAINIIITEIYCTNPIVYKVLASFESYSWESNKLHKKTITKRNELKCSHKQSLQHGLAWISTKLNPINKYFKKYFAWGLIDLRWMSTPTSKLTSKLNRWQTIMLWKVQLVEIYRKSEKHRRLWKYDDFIQRIYLFILDITNFAMPISDGDAPFLKFQVVPSLFQ